MYVGKNEYLRWTDLAMLAHLVATFARCWTYSSSLTVIVVPSDAALALPIPPKVRSRNAAHTLVVRRICAFFGTPLPLKGGFPPKKVEVVAK